MGCSSRRSTSSTSCRPHPCPQPCYNHHQHYIIVVVVDVVVIQFHWYQSSLLILVIILVVIARYWSLLFSHYCTVSIWITFLQKRVECRAFLPQFPMFWRLFIAINFLFWWEMFSLSICVVAPPLSPVSFVLSSTVVLFLVCIFNFGSCA